MRSKLTTLALVATLAGCGKSETPIAPTPAQPHTPAAEYQTPEAQAKEFTVHNCLVMTPDRRAVVYLPNAFNVDKYGTNTFVVFSHRNQQVFTYSSTQERDKAFKTLVEGWYSCMQGYRGYVKGG